MLTGTLPPVSNRATWSESAQLFDDDTGEGVDLSGATEIEIQVRDIRCGSSVLTATLSGDDITVEEETGVFSWSFTPAQMSRLCAKTYEIGILATVNEQTIQVLLGRLPILEGQVQ